MVQKKQTRTAKGVYIWLRKIVGVRIVYFETNFDSLWNM